MGKEEGEAAAGGGRNVWPRGYESRLIFLGIFWSFLLNRFNSQLLSFS